MPYSLLQSAVPLIRPVTMPFLLPKTRGDIFEDDFSSGRSGALTADSLPDWNTSYSNGLSVDSRGIRDTGSGDNKIYTSFNQGNGIIAAENFQWGGSTYTYIYVRYDFVANSGYKADYNAGTGTLTIQRITSGTAVTIITGSFTPLKAGLLQIEFVGSVIKASYNDKLICQASDSTYREGSFGLRLYRSGVSWIKAVRL